MNVQTSHSKIKQINLSPPGEIPYESQIVFPSRHEMAAVICETDAAQILIVPTQNGQQISCWHLSERHQQERNNSHHHTVIDYNVWYKWMLYKNNK